MWSLPVFYYRKIRAGRITVFVFDTIHESFKGGDYVAAQVGKADIIWM
jgi:hypothetical protein